MSDRYANYSRLKIDRPSDRVLKVTFDRPETYNSVDAETHTQLTNIWRDINDDPDISAVIVTGAGKAFSAGGDFEMIKTILENPVARMATWKEAKDLVYNIINCNKPDHLRHQRGRRRRRASRRHPRGRFDLREIRADR
jgi:enoyl-CoA hydratase